MRPEEQEEEIAKEGAFFLESQGVLDPLSEVVREKE